MEFIEELGNDVASYNTAWNEIFISLDKLSKIIDRTNDFDLIFNSIMIEEPLHKILYENIKLRDKEVHHNIIYNIIEKIYDMDDYELFKNSIKEEIGANIY